MRISPYTPIFDPRIRKGGVRVGAMIGALPTPVLSAPILAILDDLTHVNLNGARGLAYRSSHVFVCAQNTPSLTAIDVSDPSNLTHVSALTDAALAQPTHIAIDGTVAYVTSVSNDTLVSVDISNPAAMVVLDSITDAVIDGAFGVRVSGTHAYVTRGTTTGTSFSSFDISDPTNLSLVNTVDLTMRQPAKFVIDGSVAYVAVTRDDALVSVDISNPAALVVLHALSDAAFNAASDVTIIDGFAYVVKGGPAGITSVDISNPSSLVIVDTGSGSPLNTPLGIAAYGDYLLVTDVVADAVVSVNATDPTTLTVDSSITDGTILDFAADVIVVGSIAYVSALLGDRLVSVSLT